MKHVPVQIDIFEDNCKQITLNDKFNFCQIKKPDATTEITDLIMIHCNTIFLCILVQ